MKCRQSLTDRIRRQQIWPTLNSIARAAATTSLVFRARNFGELSFQPLLSSVCAPKVGRRNFVLAVVVFDNVLHDHFIFGPNKPNRNCKALLRALCE